MQTGEAGISNSLDAALRMQVRNQVWFLADVAKLADAPDLGSGAARHVGSTPSIRTYLGDWFIGLLVYLSD